jgi:hypothetical protein
MRKLADLPVATWLQHRRFELAADYLRRGRPFAEVPTAHLMLRWLETVVAWADHYDSVRLRAQASDLQTELELRRSDPPWRLVESALRVIDARTRQAIEALPKDAKDRIAAQLVADMNGLHPDGSRASRH